MLSCCIPDRLGEVAEQEAAATRWLPPKTHKGEGLSEWPRSGKLRPCVQNATKAKRKLQTALYMHLSAQADRRPSSRPGALLQSPQRPLALRPLVASRVGAMSAAHNDRQQLSLLSSRLTRPAIPRRVGVLTQPSAAEVSGFCQERCRKCTVRSLQLFKCAPGCRAKFRSMGNQVSTRRPARFLSRSGRSQVLRPRWPTRSQLLNKRQPPLKARCTL